MHSIIITGAGSGIGRATARTFLAKGWQVGLLGRRKDALAETAAVAPRALILPCDVTDEAQVSDSFALAVKEFGRLDVLFNNAGLSVRNAPIDEIPLADWLAT